jgi:hypothetical protein
MSALPIAERVSSPDPAPASLELVSLPDHAAELGGPEGDACGVGAVDIDPAAGVKAGSLRSTVGSVR